MRLLKTGPFPDGNEKLIFQSFNDQDLPEYAILSHTWDQDADNEVLYTDVMTNTGQQKPGFSKIRATLLQARRAGYSYAWVDTCEH